MTTRSGEFSKRQLEMLLETSLRQVCTAITAHMNTPPEALRDELRNHIRVGLMISKVLGKISREHPRHFPTVEIPEPSSDG
jgi:flagellar biosynthesis regulator FlaF